MDNKIPQFNTEIFKDYEETYKISTLFFMPETEIKKILKAGFIYDPVNNYFFSNIHIVNKTYNLRLGHYDGGVALYMKNEADTYSTNSKKFPAKKIVIEINNEKSISYSVDYIFLKFEQYLNEIVFNNTKNAMINKIPNDINIEIDYTVNNINYHKINKSYIYGKTFEGKLITSEIRNTILSLSDLITIDKLIEEGKLKIENQKNKSFKTFVFEDKNKIQ